MDSKYIYISDSTEFDELGNVSRDVKYSWNVEAKLWLGAIKLNEIKDEPGCFDGVA